METPAEESVNNVHSEDFSYLCRACLSRNSSTSLKDEPWLLCIFKSILGLANIDINLENNLPTEICDGCLQKLEQISAFISLIRFSDKNLHQALINKECLEKKTHGVVEAVKKKSDDFGCNLKRSTINPKLEKNVFEGNIQISGKDNDETMPESEPHTKGSELKTNVEEIDEYWDSPEFVSCSQEIIQSNELSSHSIKSECKVEDDIEITKTEIQPAYETCKDAIERNSEGCNSINDSSVTPSDIKFQSDLCCKKFSSENTLKEHSIKHTENSITSPCKTYPFSSVVCSKGIIVKDTPKKEHCDIFSENCSNERILKILLSESELVKCNVETESEPVECDASSDTFSCENPEESLHSHSSVTPSDVKFQSHLSCKEFSSENTLKDHSIRHKEKEIAMKENLGTHKEEHCDIFSENCSNEENKDIQSGRVHIIDRTTLAVSSWYYDPVSTHHSLTSCSNRVFRSVAKYYNPICPIALLDLNENCIIQS
ncbi:hypothetical protein JTB14_005410 [Gonioctena quinquepunctata]|nr:hypothetical protein JTB14_005410 [Gonioctena quinquepunctata]